MGSLSSFRGATAGDLVRAGAATAVLRGEFVVRGRRLLVEVTLSATGGRTRVQMNRQPLRRTADLCEEVQILVFQPDDLQTVKGPPGARRDALDDAVVALHPRCGEARRRLASCLRQRNALLRQAAGSRRGDIDETTRRSLDVWDDRFAAAAETWAHHRRRVLAELQPRMARLFGLLADTTAAAVGLSYEPDWLVPGLAAALIEARPDDLQRAATTIGPHRDDVEWRLDGMAARTHASQGNQRALSLAFRLAVHDALTEAAGEPPLLLLDDVFSELDPPRQERLLTLLPPGQILLATAGEVPVGAEPDQILAVRDLPSASAVAR